MKFNRGIFSLLFISVFSLFILSSCKKNNLISNTSEVEEMLKDKFGDNLYFTNFIVGENRQIGSTITATLTTDPSSMKMESWAYANGRWINDSEVTLEITGEANPEAFMLSLEEINLPKVQEIINHAKAHLKKEKGLDNPFVVSVGISTPDDDHKSKSTYGLFLEPENGGTSFRFKYTLDGDFESMNY